jgi:hypothetical protein
MKTAAFISFFVLSILLGCARTEKRETDTVRPSLIEKTLIDKLFQNWKVTQVKNGVFFGEDSCNTSYYIKTDSLQLKAESGIGLPDSSEIHYLYQDLNNDNRVDALIYFTPYQCDGGNATMFTRFEILIISKGQDYYLTDNYFDSLNEGKKGFFHWDSLSQGKILGTYFEFRPNDGRCCPGIHNLASIDFDSKTVQIHGERK